MVVYFEEAEGWDGEGEGHGVGVDSGVQRQAHGMFEAVVHPRVAKIKCPKSLDSWQRSADRIRRYKYNIMPFDRYPRKLAVRLSMSMTLHPYITQRMPHISFDGYGYR